MKKLFLFLPLILILAGCGQQPTLVRVNLDKSELDQITTSTDNLIQDIRTGFNGQGIEGEIPAEVTIPNKILLDVDFAMQAPFSDWSAPYDEACEEASMIMAYYYFAKKELTKDLMNEEILKLVDWEEKQGYKIDLTAEDTVDILNNYFNLNAWLENEVTADRIKYELSLGHLVIPPTAGRELDNDYFRQPGPIYHMFVIKGYDSKDFIVNDVGIGKGEGFRYSYEDLIDAVHDWDYDLAKDEMSAEEIKTTQKVLIIVAK